jgi:two-component system catabolic regulation response regulator CreB
MAQRILVIEDEPAIADTITYALKSEGFEPMWCATGGQGRSALQGGNIALVVLDVGLPDCSGFDLCREFRKSSTVPVIILTARGAEVDRVVGLEIGADDYMVKPFSPRELAARVRAVLRRAPGVATVSEGTAAAVGAGPFTIDEARKAIMYHGAARELSRCEYRILETLVRSPGQVFSRRQLMEAAWDEPEVSDERTVDTHVKTIRKKLAAIRAD